MPDKNQLGGISVRAINSIRWNAVSIGLSTLLQAGQMVWLARLLSIEDFGVMAMTWVVIRLTSPLFSGGIGQSIIRQKEIGKEHFSTLFWLQTGLGVMAFSIVYASSAFWARFFEEPQVPALLFACSLSFLVAPAGNAFQALLTRRLLFDKIAAIQLAGSMADLATSVWLAYRGWGPVSICWGYFARNLTGSALSWWMERGNTPLLTIRIGAVRHMLKFAFFETANNLLLACHTVIDKAILSRFLTAHELGLYFMTWELAMMPLSKISPVFTRVSFPVFSKMHEDPVQLNRYFLNMTRPLIALNLFVLAVLGLLAPQVLAVFLGSEWMAAGTCLSLLCVFGLEKVVVNSGAGIFLAKGRADINLLWNLATAVAVFLFLPAFLHFSPTMEAAAMAQIAAVALLSGIWIGLLRKIGGIFSRPLLLMLLRSLALSIPLLAVLLLWAFWNGPAWGILAGGLLSACLIYPISLWLFDRSLINNIFR